MHREGMRVASKRDSADAHRTSQSKSTRTWLIIVCSHGKIMTFQMKTKSVAKSQRIILHFGADTLQPFFVVASLALRFSTLYGFVSRGTQLSVCEVQMIETEKESEREKARNREQQHVDVRATHVPFLLMRNFGSNINYVHTCAHTHRESERGTQHHTCSHFVYCCMCWIQILFFRHFFPFAFLFRLIIPIRFDGFKINQKLRLELLYTFFAVWLIRSFVRSCVLSAL